MSTLDVKVFETGPYKGTSYFIVRTKHPEYFISLVEKPVKDVLNELEFIQYCLHFLTKKTVTFDETSPVIHRVSVTSSTNDKDPKDHPSSPPLTSSKSESITMYFDGCSKGNPGKSGAGACVVNDTSGEEIWSQSMFVGEKVTNNVAEYNGLLLGLKEIAKRNVKNITIKGDSKLVIEQIQKKVNTRSPTMKPLKEEACKLLDTIREKGVTIEFEHVLRKYNKRADELANKGLQT